ncbi:tail tape measure protein, partial [Pseudomonas syringae pv. pisi str. 1704B]
MALTSRLAIEVDSRSAQQKVDDLRRGLQALNDAGLRTGPIISGAGNAINGAGQNARSATAQVQGLERQVKSLGSAAAGIAGPLAAAFSAKAFYDAAEAYSTLTNRMKLVTDGAGELAAAQKAVFAISQSSYQPLNATAELYQRIATNQKELKLTGEGVAGVVGTISKTLAISGASAASANAALIQLGQAFASGTLRGEELNSVMEQAPALAQAIAAGMGKTVGELRTLGAAGLLTADSVVKALQAQRIAVDQLFDKTAV